MVKQGDIIMISFDPSIGHEEKKTRPALVVSNDSFYNKTKMVLVCPISHAKTFPLHIELPNDLKTDGLVLCEHLRSLDINARGYTVIENVGEAFIDDILYLIKLCL